MKLCTKSHWFYSDTQPFWKFCPYCGIKLNKKVLNKERKDYARKRGWIK